MISFAVFKLVMDSIETYEESLITVLLLENCMNDKCGLIAKYCKSKQNTVSHCDAYGTYFNISTLPGLYEAINRYDLEVGTKRGR